jgi:hypothetical protein
VYSVLVGCWAVRLVWYPSLRKDSSLNSTPVQRSPALQGFVDSDLSYARLPPRDVTLPEFTVPMQTKKSGFQLWCTILPLSVASAWATRAPLPLRGFCPCRSLYLQALLQASLLLKIINSRGHNIVRSRNAVSTFAAIVDHGFHKLPENIPPCT